jgi:Fe-S-cluster containining protein
MSDHALLHTPACIACGACCVCEHGAAWYVELTRHEAETGPFSCGGAHHAATIRQTFAGIEVAGLRTKQVVVQHGALAGRSLCVCAFLEGEPGVDVRCAIYPSRPEACVGFRRVGPGCVAVLTRLGKSVLA